MTGIRRCQLSRGYLKDTDPHGDKHHGPVFVTQVEVDSFQGLARVTAGHQLVLDQTLGDGHKHGCRHALVGHVCDYQRQMVLIDHKEIIEVTADLPGGGHGGVQFKLFPVRECREFAGDHLSLDPGSHRQLLVYPGSLRLFLVLLLQISNLGLVVMPNGGDTFVRKFISAHPGVIKTVNQEGVRSQDKKRQSEEDTKYYTEYLD